MNKLRQSIRVVFFVCCCICLCSCSEPSPTLKLLTSDAVILAFGDSLTFGTGANSQTESYPAVLQQLSGWEVINAGIVGETSQLGLLRLPSILKLVKPDLVILCHGGNDLIRQLGKQQLKKNLKEMIRLIQSSGADVLLIAIPQFSLTLAVPTLYEELATAFNIPVELTIIRELEQNSAAKSDTIHPNANGYKLLAERIWDLISSLGKM